MLLAQSSGDKLPSTRTHTNIDKLRLKLIYSSLLISAHLYSSLLICIDTSRSNSDGPGWTLSLSSKSCSLKG